MKEIFKSIGCCYKSNSLNNLHKIKIGHLHYKIALFHELWSLHAPWLKPFLKSAASTLLH